MTYTIGLMSGTSMDGIDAAIVDVENHQCIAALTIPYPPATKSFLLEVLSHMHHTFETLQALNHKLGEAFGESVNLLLAKANFNAGDIKAIGSHGQTVCHDATAQIPYTLQLGCPHTIAEMTGIPVVADFRTRDMVLGGQGAPFAPIYHQALFASLPKPLVVLNIGGISNATFLTHDALSGYDLGPGNVLMDAWVLKHWGQSYDKNGEIAASGQVNQAVLNRLMQDPFFSREGPKSIGKEYFSLAWLEKAGISEMRPEDVQATLLALTVESIAETVGWALAQQPKPMLGQGPTYKGEILVCGGGVHNTALMSSLAKCLPQAQVRSTAYHGANPDFIEAMIFAWLANEAISGRTVDMQSITGALKPAKLGVIYPI